MSENFAFSGQIFGHRDGSGVRKAQTVSGEPGQEPLARIQAKRRIIA